VVLLATIIFLGCVLFYLNVPRVDELTVRSDDPKWSEAYQQPLDLALCPALHWGCRYLTVDHRTLVGHVWTSRAITDLRAEPRGDLKKSLAAIEGIFLRARTLRFAKFDESRVYGADMIRADLSHATFSEADLSGANLFGANLSRADLSWANLSRADLLQADLTGVSLFKANLSGAPLVGANLSGKNLSWANLSRASLSKANLSGAQLFQANLSGADLSWANLSGAILVKANLSGANLAEATITQDELNQACGTPEPRVPFGLTVHPCK